MLQPYRALPSTRSHWNAFSFPLKTCHAQAYAKPKMSELSNTQPDSPKVGASSLKLSHPTVSGQLVVVYQSILQLLLCVAINRALAIGDLTTLLYFLSFFAWLSIFFLFSHPSPS